MSQWRDELLTFVSRLAPDGKPRPAVNEPRAFTAMAAGLPPGAVDWAVEVSHRSSDAVVMMMGSEAAPLLETDARAGIEISTLLLLRHLTGLSAEFELNAEQVAAADRMARFDWPYERFMAGQRRVQDIVLESLLDRAAGHRPATARPGLLRAVTGIASHFYDRSVSAIIEEYLAERRRAIAQAVTDRRRVTRALVAGERVPADLTAQVLGIDLAQHHLALVLWPDVPGRAHQEQSALELAAERAADALHAPAPLTVPDDGDTGTMLCWITSASPFPPDHVHALTEVLTWMGAYAAIGPPGQGASGFRRSHLGARDAERVARLSGQSVTAYDQVGAVALLSTDLERTRWFVTEELGPLAAPGDATTADLRTTALCYLDCGRSLVRTAAALHVHRNTVVYRLQNIERLLGHPLDEHPFATHTALTLTGLLGSTVLGG